MPNELRIECFECDDSGYFGYMDSKDLFEFLSEHSDCDGMDNTATINVMLECE